MDQEMEADEFFPDKVISESDVTDVAQNDMSAAEDNAVKQNDGGDSVVNGEEGAEEMETDEPPSVQGEDMETTEEPENYLEDIGKENETEVDTGEEISGQTENDTPGSSTALAKENIEYVEDREKQDPDNTDLAGDENDFGSNLDLEGEISNEDIKTLAENEEINENNDNDNILDLEEPLGETEETENTSEKSDIVRQEESSTEKDEELSENIEARTDSNKFGEFSHEGHIEGDEQHTGIENKDTQESADDKPTETSVEYKETLEIDSEKRTETTEMIGTEETVNEDELLYMDVNKTQDIVEENKPIEEQVEQKGNKENKPSVNLEQKADVASLDGLEHSEDAHETSLIEDSKKSMDTETEAVPEHIEEETDQTTLESIGYENQDSNEFDSVKDFGEVKEATETETKQMQQSLKENDTDKNEESKEVDKVEDTNAVDVATEILAKENSQNTEDSIIDDKTKNSKELDATEDSVIEQAVEEINNEIATESTMKVTDEKDESNDYKIEEDETNEGLEPTAADKEEEMETDVIESSESISERIGRESEKAEETVTDKLADVIVTSVESCEKKEKNQISEKVSKEDEIAKPQSESDTSKAPPTDEISESVSSLPSAEKSPTPDLEGSSQEKSEAVSHSEVQPSGDNSSRSDSVTQSETTVSGDNSNQSEETSSKKSPEFDMSDVKIKKERMDSTESDKTNDNDSSNTGSSQMRIVGVTSAVGVEDKADNSELASVKTDDEDKKKVEKINKVSVKDESLAEATATEKEVLNKKVNEELRRKIKQEKKTQTKEEEDDDVIAIKEERKPVQKPKPSKIQTCIVCGKVGKCKYNIVRNGDVKHLCDDNCFKRFRSSPTTYLKQAENATQNQSKPETQSSSAPAPTPVKNSAPVKATPNQQPSFQAQSQVYKTCTVCQLMNVRTSKPFLNWQGLDFCGEECLGKYQSGLSNNCSYCSGAIFPNNKAKNCCRVGNEVKHFCSANCNNDYVKRMKLCAFCNKDLAQSTDSFMAPVGETFKDFCSQSCLQKFEDKNNKDLEIVGVQKGQKASKVSKGNFVCAVCGKLGPVKHEFKLDSKVNRLCSDPCFSAFQYANKLTLNTCDNCGTNLNSENQAPQYVQFEGQQRRFCSFMCVNSFRNLNKKTVPCAWCGNKKSNFDMIERVDATNKYQLFCSLNCLSLYRVNLQATSNQAVTCDQCHKFVPAQYHLTMSDASVRNFCSYSCVMQFQAQFQTPAKQVLQHNSVGNTVGVGRGQVPAQQPPQQKLQQQQQTTTRSGRIVQKAAKVADTLQQAGKGRGVKKDADSFPIISNVVSLAPQGTQHGQQQINIKSSTPVTVTNQQQGIKATTTTTGSGGTQTVQQQIIIQPPPPKTVKNKSMLCKPFTQTKATSCRPHTQTKEVNTDGKIEPDKYLIPVPVPVYCPTPLAMYSVPTPILVPVPVPIPVPVFIPTTKKNANSILKQIKEIREKIPADPLEAELLMMAEAVAEKEDDSSSSSEEEDNTAPPAKESNTSVAPATGGELGEDMLQMALRMASEMSDEPVMDLENSLEPVAVNTEPPPPPKPVVPTPQPVEEEEEYIPSSARSRRSRGGNKRQSRGTPRRNPKRQKVEVTPQYREATPSPPAPSAPPPDANFHLKYTYGVNAFKHWVIQKNSQIEQASKPGHGKSLRTFKTDILQCTADELNYSLCLFVKEVRKPNGEEYAVDSIYYLCLGIQQYLFENGRIDNIFTDFYYERFTEQLNEILTRYEPKLNHAGQLVCRIEEEHLWESKQLGAHSPHVLLNSLVYFNTKYFMLKTSEDHLKLSFTHIMKHWKKTATGRGSGTGPNAGRSVYLRYYCPTPQGKDNQKKKKEEMPVYEQTENLDNPLRCPVKLYEFYLSKCPETLKSRSDMFYLKPERSSVPDSPVWYSNQPINIEHLTKLLNRIRLVREIQEAHLHTRPIYI